MTEPASEGCCEDHSKERRVPLAQRKQRERESMLIPKKQKGATAHPSGRPRKIAKYDNVTNDAGTSGYHMQNKHASVHTLHPIQKSAQNIKPKL